MPIYRAADVEVDGLVRERLRKFYEPLVDAGVTITNLFAFPSVEGGVALTHHGYPAAAIIRVTTLEQRVAGQKDVLIRYDGHNWTDQSEEEQAALVDHEIHHLQLLFDKEGRVKTDDAHRPRLRLRRHDWQLGGFRAVAQRHGIYAAEVKAARDLRDRFGNLLFSFAADLAATGS